MSGGQTEVHRDSDYLASGTHTGPDASATLIDKNLPFRSNGVIVGLAIYNVTQSTNGLITACDEESVTDDTNTWNNGDVYEIYKTAAKNAYISHEWVDLSRGWPTDRDELKDGWREDDIDIDDKGRKDVFGPGQPEKDY